MHQQSSRPPIPSKKEFETRLKAIQPKVVGNVTAEEIYPSIGKALSYWGRLESTLALLFSIFTEANFAHTDAAVRAFGVVLTLQTKLAMLRAALEIFDDKQGHAISQIKDFPTAEMKLVLEHIDAASKLRNNIVHGEVVALSHEEGQHHYFLTASYFSSNKMRAKTRQFFEAVKGQSDPFSFYGATYRYTAADIDQCTAIFEQLNEMAFGIYMEHFHKVCRTAINNIPVIDE